jgi:mannose-6-phosphate isomerase-like protein (cupin superfamily)
MIVRLDSVPEDSQPERSLVLRRAINAEAHSPALSVTWVRIDGHHDRIVNQGSDRVYYVIEGSGNFQVGDGAPLEAVRATDFVFIPRGVPYEFEGAMTYLVINGPAFTAGADTVLPSAFDTPG